MNNANIVQEEGKKSFGETKRHSINIPEAVIDGTMGVKRSIV